MSSLKPFMAGVGTVAAALVVGFGGGMILAERFTSTTAVPEQSKIEKRNNDQREEASAKPPEQMPAEPKSVLTETIRTPLSNNPLSAVTRTFVSSQPEQATPSLQAQQTAPQQNASPTQQPDPVIERPRTVGTAPNKPDQRETIREAAPPQEQKIAQPGRDDPPAEVSTTPVARQQAAPPDRGRAESAQQRRKEARQQQKKKERKQIARQDASDNSRDKETDGYAARVEDEEAIETSPGMRQRPRVIERRMAREIVEEVDEPAERTTEYRRPVGLPPFFGLFGQ